MVSLFPICTYQHCLLTSFPARLWHDTWFGLRSGWYYLRVVQIFKHGSEGRQYTRSEKRQSKLLSPAIWWKFYQWHFCSWVSPRSSAMHIRDAVSNAAKTSSVMPRHGLAGAKSDLTKVTALLLEYLNWHFDYLLQLGEVRATRMIATLVDGVAGRTNREKVEEMVYLPISMGYQNCYRQYIALLGCKVKWFICGGRGRR